MGLDTVELIMAIESHFDIEIPNHEAEKLGTAGNVYDHVVEALATKRNAILPERAKLVVWEQIVEVVVNQLGVVPSEVTKTASFVDDLRAD